MSYPFSGLAGRYLASSETLRGIELVQWYGVRVFTDHLDDRSPGPNLPGIPELEWEAGRRDPYRSVARLLHLVGRKSSGRKVGSYSSVHKGRADPAKMLTDNTGQC